MTHFDTEEFHLDQIKFARDFMDRTATFNITIMGGLASLAGLAVATTPKSNATPAQELTSYDIAVAVFSVLCIFIAISTAVRIYFVPRVLEVIRYSLQQIDQQNIISSEKLNVMQMGADSMVVLARATRGSCHGVVAFSCLIMVGACLNVAHKQFGFSLAPCVLGIAIFAWFLSMCFVNYVVINRMVCDVPKPDNPSKFWRFWLKITSDKSPVVSDWMSEGKVKKPDTSQKYGDKQRA